MGTLGLPDVQLSCSGPPPLLSVSPEGAERFVGCRISYIVCVRVWWTWQLYCRAVLVLLLLLIVVSIWCLWDRLGSVCGGWLSPFIVNN